MRSEAAYRRTATGTLHAGAPDALYKRLEAMYSMIAQVRIYTINKGMMDAWLQCFKEHLQPIHEQYGIKIVGAWVNRPQNEFIWIRTFTDEADLETKTKAYNNSPERRALGDYPGSLHAKMEVRTVETVFDPTAR